MEIRLARMPIPDGAAASHLLAMDGTTSPLSRPLVLPCGATLQNRLAKAAMSEGMADADNHVTPRLVELYRRWARSGAGLLLSGNMQVDRDHLERPGNVVLDGTSGAEALAELAEAGKADGAHFWAQISHTGRQVSRSINAEPLAPSSVKLDFQLRFAGYVFGRPREMTTNDIAKAIDQFAFAARQARAAGFTGVQLHGAHGYLISQFLSPRVNRRTDDWGGSLRNRSRFLFEVLAAVRAAVGPGFPVGLKLNASDFQVGGFTNAECVEIVRSLDGHGLDLLELSGGSLEQPKVVGAALRDQGVDGLRATREQREAYFIELAGAVKATAAMPVMVTGGFRTASAMNAALEAGQLDLIGLGRPLVTDPLTPARLLRGETSAAPSPERDLAVFHQLGWFSIQLERLADGLDADRSLGGADATRMFKEIEAQTTAALLARRRNAAPLPQSFARDLASRLRKTHPGETALARLGRGIFRALRRPLDGLVDLLKNALVNRARRRFG